MEFAVEIRNLEKRFGKLVALKNINLQIEKGIIFGIVGPDGSGKSTLLKLLCGLIHQERGEIKVLGKNIKEEFDFVKKKIGYLSQEFNLYEDLTVDENIEFFGEIYRVREWRERREEILKFTNLLPFRKRLAEKLSGGMKKKLALACTLIHEPEIFILDEPTMGVDPLSRVELWKIIFQLSKRGLTIILSTSYIDEAERCNKIAVMYNGSVLYSGEPERFRKKMRKSVLEITVTEPVKAFEILKGSNLSKEFNLSGNRIRIISADLKDLEKEIYKIFELNGIRILETHTHIPSLEDSFVSILMEERNGEL